MVINSQYLKLNKHQSRHTYRSNMLWLETTTRWRCACPLHCT
jgi:hypothetical protein